MGKIRYGELNPFYILISMTCDIKCILSDDNHYSCNIIKNQEPYEDIDCSINMSTKTATISIVVILSLILVGILIYRRTRK